MKDKIYEQLTQIALKRSIPYCLGCHQEAKDGRCPKCASDDLARLLPGIGADWNLEWIFTEILREELTPVNLEENFEESIRQCYPETVQVAWMTLDTITVAKEMDPVSWAMALSEWSLSFRRWDDSFLSCSPGPGQ